MPYVFDTVTSRDSPSAASQAEDTSRTIGIMLARARCVFRIISVAIMNSDNIMLSRHDSEDIRWDQYINNSIRDTVNVTIIIYTKSTW